MRRIEALCGLEPRTLWLLAAGVGRFGYKGPLQRRAGIPSSSEKHEGILTQYHWCAICPSRTVVQRGLEPRTLRLLAVRSDQLSYETLWKGRKDVLNQ